MELRTVFMFGEPRSSVPYIVCVRINMICNFMQQNICIELSQFCPYQNMNAAVCNNELSDRMLPIRDQTPFIHWSFAHTNKHMTRPLHKHTPPRPRRCHGTLFIFMFAPLSAIAKSFHLNGVIYFIMNLGILFFSFSVLFLSILSAPYDGDGADFGGERQTPNLYIL